MQACAIRGFTPEEGTVPRTIYLALATLMLALPAFAQTPPEVTLTRLDCGNGFNDQPPMTGANVAGFKDWIGTSRKVEPLTADKDVFGDGSVMVLRTPGHTPGHQSLLVRLKQKGPVVLVGDAAHFRENYLRDGVPGFNYDRAQTIASIERIKQIEKNLKATIVIQHDPRDIAKLPAFPAAAK